MSSYACTLFENNYHYGVAVLLNSLYSNGFRGTVFVGYRGDLPVWCSDIKTNGEMLITDGLTVKFSLIKGNRHLTNEKGLFLQQLLNTEVPKGTSIFYFDPDIVFKGAWQQVEGWARYGVVLVEDCTFPYLPATHPLRYQWLECAEIAKLNKKREISRYYNAGFIGINHDNQDILTVWDDLISISAFLGYDNTKFPRDDRSFMWSAADQDHLNLSLMVTDTPIVTLGPDGMDFEPGGYVMSHAVGSKKPWTKNYLKLALQGEPPTPTDKLFWQYTNGPLFPFSAKQVRRAVTAIRLGSAIGRFIRRPRLG